MKTTQIKCDRCGNVVNEAIEVRIREGREPDSSGNGYVTNSRVVDLCNECNSTIITQAVNAGLVSL